MDNLKLIKTLFDNMNGLKARNVQLGYGSFITIDFGQDIIVEVETSKGIEKFSRGEWHLWLYMTAWRIEENSIPIAGCEDSKKTIEKALKIIENKKLIGIEVLNQAYDMKIIFESSIEINLFSIYTEKGSESENWMLFTPERKVLSIYPGNVVTYDDSSAV